MDSQSISTFRIKRITPRLMEIMNRMVLGQPPKQIREEFGISPLRFSLIINSPLFKLELKKKLLKREEVILDIHENILEGAKLGSKLYRDILESPDGYPTDTKLKAADRTTSLALKLITSTEEENGRNGNNSFEGKGYEQRLREVTFRETVTTVDSSEPPSKQLESALTENYPQEEGEDEDISTEADLLFGKIEKEENFELLPQIEKVISKMSESVSKHESD